MSSHRLTLGLAANWRPAQMLGALGIAALIGCSSTPPPEEPVLTADPPVGSPEALSDSKVQTEVERAVQYIKNKDFAEAKKHLESALAEQPDHASANHYMGIVNDMLGDKQAAEKHYKMALAADPNLVESAQNLAVIYLEADPPAADKAIEVLKKALERAPDDEGLNGNLAYAYGLKKDIPAASAAYERSLKKAESAERRYAYGALLLESGDKKKAAEQLGKALDATKDDVEMLASLGLLLGSAGGYADCVRAWDRALAVKVTAEWQVRRGICRHELGDEKAARADYDAAIKTDPKFAAAYYYLGVSHSLEKGGWGAAVAAIEKAVALGGETDIGKRAKTKLDELKKKK